MTQEPDRRSIWPDSLLAAASLSVAAAAVYGVLSIMWPHPRLALAVCVAIGGVAAFGVMSALGAAAETRRCRKERYWVRFVNEGRAPEGPVRGLSLECARVKLGPWRVLGWEIIVPAEAEWDSHLPEWAGGRRGEIMNLIVAAFGGGTLFRFRSAAEQGDEADEARAV